MKVYSINMRWVLQLYGLYHLLVKNNNSFYHSHSIKFLTPPWLVFSCCNEWKSLATFFKASIVINGFECFKIKFAFCFQYFWRKFGIVARPIILIHSILQIFSYSHFLHYTPKQNLICSSTLEIRYGNSYFFPWMSLVLNSEI